MHRVRAVRNWDDIGFLLRKDWVVQEHFKDFGR